MAPLLPSMERFWKLRTLPPPALAEVPNSDAVVEEDWKDLTLDCVWGGDLGMRSNLPSFLRGEGGGVLISLRLRGKVWEEGGELLVMVLVGLDGSHCRFDQAIRLTLRLPSPILPNLRNAIKRGNGRRVHQGRKCRGGRRCGVGAAEFLQHAVVSFASC